ncbi:MAG: helicase PcrA [Pseudomonadota bacterium]|jgi:DNA helicase-2/ATP-dependent DNA helicase PcrA
MNDARTSSSAQLNPAQQQAVETLAGPLVVYAGAGSGKTRVICHRIAALIESGVPPSSILAVTFTNKAAKEMRERVEHIVGGRARSMIVSTFHSACARFLRIFAREAGYSESFSILDDDDQKSLIKEVTQSLNVPDKLLSVATIKNKIDRLKNAGLSPEDYAKQIREHAYDSQAAARAQMRRYGEDDNAELIQKCYALYQYRLKSQNAMDFNDLLMVMVNLLQSNKSVLGQLQNRFQFFFVDEFQDTNPIQFKLIQLLSSHTNNLCIVGDDDQSIYSWRGAEPAFILDFQKFYPDARIIKLEQNYRSSSNIVRAATQLIAHNLRRAPKTLWTQADSGEDVICRGATDPFDEAHYVVGELIRKYEKRKRFADFAILYRTNAQSRVLEDELRRRMLPYIIYGSVRFYERAEIKTLLAYLRLVVNPDDNNAFIRAISTPRRGFGDKALEKLKEVAREKNTTLLRVACALARNEFTADVGRGLSALKNFERLFNRARSTLDMTGKPSIVLRDILADTQFEEFLRSAHPEDFDERWLNVIELQNALVEIENRPANEQTDELAVALGKPEDIFTESAAASPGVRLLSQFLEQALLTVEPTVKSVQSGQSDAITLMTIHSSKGLEFPVVFICGLEEGVLPHNNSLESEPAIEEERRLLYVAMTRARESLTLTNIRRNRFRPDLPAEISRFLAELPSEGVQMERRAPRAHWDHGDFSQSTFQSSRTTQQQASFSEADKSTLRNIRKDVFSFLKSADDLAGESEQQEWFAGQRVKHKLFGSGIVERVEKSLDGFRLEVRFPVVGLKKLMHTYLQPE